MIKVLLSKLAPAPVAVTCSKRIVITATAGRTGTGFLQKVFAAFPDFYSAHENTHSPLHGNLQRALRDINFAKNVWYRKFKFINAVPQGNYFESSHLINKGFIEALLEIGVVPDLIILRRRFRSVATSLCELKTVPARTKLGRAYLISPEDPGVLKIASWKSLTDYQLCYWYVIESERRSRYYKELIESKGGAVFETSVEDLLRSEGELERLCGRLRIPLNDGVKTRLSAMKGERVNERGGSKKKLQYTAEELDRQEKEVLHLLKDQIDPQSMVRWVEASALP